MSRYKPLPEPVLYTSHQAVSGKKQIWQYGLTNFFNKIEGRQSNMPNLRVIKYPNPLLQQPSKEVVEIDAGVTSFITDLVSTMRGSTGVGIAAPQVGRLLRIIVVDVTPKNPGHGELVLINPKITAQSGKRKGREGCLSVPGFIANIKRSKKVTVSALDRDGKQVEIEAKGFEAVALQHEIDHLDGILFLDHIVDMKRDLLKRKPANT